MNDNRNYGLDIARIIATKIRNYKRDFSVFDRKILVYYMLYSTYSLAAFYQSNVIGVIIKQHKILS